MAKAALLLATGFEEAEAITVADILRRAGITCDLVGLGPVVAGTHGITVQCDRVLDQNTAEAYDMVILPGGLPGAENLRDSDLVIQTLQKMNAQGKWIGAICAAPIALERAGVLKNRKFTAYPGYENEIRQGQFLEDIVVVDHNLITSRGPATAYAFGYTLAEALGKNTAALRKGMLYDFAGGRWPEKR